MIENFWLNAAYSLTPTILIGLVFWFVMRTILRADRGERDAYADIEREEREKRGLTTDKGPSP
jgi:flagellar biosynthesis/type III secretory pathway M-ring protein FliF/YscJ